MGRGNRWIPAVAGMVVVVTALHYATDAVQQTDHVIYAKLYYVPLAAAALAYGLRGGLLTASAIVALYGPFFFLRARAGDRPAHRPGARGPDRGGQPS